MLRTTLFFRLSYSFFFFFSFHFCINPSLHHHHIPFGQISKQTMPDPLHLTFGVEIECVVVFAPDEFEDAISLAEGFLWDEKHSLRLSHDDKLRIICRNKVIQILRDNGFQTYVYGSGKGDQQWTVEPDASIAIEDGRRDDGYLECDVEISSPALRFCPEALRRVKRLVAVLRGQFRVEVNTSCGFHVHIGNRRSGFPLQTLKHLCMLTAMFEHQLSSLHPADRVGNPTAKPPSALFRGQNPWDTVAAVQDCRSRGQLIRLYASDGRGLDRCFAYNLLPLVVEAHRTIEFRQHKGTVHGAEMISWVQVAGGIVNAMHEIGTEGLTRLISACAFDRKFTVLDLFRRLKLDALCTFYLGRLHVHPRLEPLWVPGRKAMSVEAGPRRLTGDERWEEMERRHRVERRRELERLERRHELERQWELERRAMEVDAPRRVA